MIRPALYDLAGARSRARNAYRLLYADGWTIGDPLACYVLAVRDIRRARRALRAAGITPPPVRGRLWRLYR